MIVINLDDPALTIGPAQQPDLRPLNGLPVLYVQETDVVRFIIQGQNFDVPQGTQNDGMSVPNAVRTLSGLEQDGCHRIADKFHDAAYQCQGKLTGTTLILTRQQCDDIHKRLCLLSGMTPAKCDTVHYFLGLFGWIAWDRYDPVNGLMKAEFFPDPRTASIHELVQFNILHCP